MSCKQIGSRNRAKVKTKLGTLHNQVSNARQDFLHQITTDLVRKYDEICIENLNVQGMMKNHKLARAIADIGFHECKHQLLCKADQSGKVVKSVGRFFPQ